MNAFQKVKKNITDNKTAYATCAGVVTGVVLTSRYYEPILQASSDALTSALAQDDLLTACEKVGLKVYAFDPIEEAKYLASLK